MTFEILANLIESNDIPKDVALQSDSGWECCETEMNGVWYNQKENRIVFTQNGDRFDRVYYQDPDWKCIHSDDEYFNKYCIKCSSNKNCWNCKDGSECAMEAKDN